MKYLIDIEGNEFVVLHSVLYTEEAPYSSHPEVDGWESATPDFAFVLNVDCRGKSIELTSRTLREYLKDYPSKGKYTAIRPVKELT